MPMEYKIKCHCGSVQLDIETDLSIVKQCNCSMCKRKKCKNEYSPKRKYKIN